MEARWYFNQSGQQYGPVTDADLKQLAANGRIQPSDLIWREGLADWIPAARTKGLFKPDNAKKSIAASGPTRLKSCPDCDRSVSLHADNCPGCGRPMRQLSLTHRAAPMLPFLDRMPPLTKKKHPALGLVIGLLFGCIGTGIYFRTFLDFLVPFVVLVVLGVLGVGLGALPGWAFAGIWGMVRAMDSNNKLDALASGDRK